MPRPCAAIPRSSEVKSRDTAVLGKKESPTTAVAVARFEHRMESAGAAARPPGSERRRDPQRPVPAEGIDVLTIDPRVLPHGHLPRDHPSEPHPQGIWHLLYQ